MSLEQGVYAAFGIGVPLSIWGFMAYLRGNAKTKSENESSQGTQERKVKKYTSDGRPVQ